jgi:hypothetical protein
VEAAPSARVRARRVASHALALALLAAMACIADLGAAREGPSFDEPLHLAAGAALLATGDFRLDQGSGVLPQIWAALPLWWSGASLDEGAAAWARSDIWGLGRALLYGSQRDPGTVLEPARRMVLALYVAQGALVYLWSLRLFGPGGAWISLALYAVCPNLLAHGRLVTSDLATALAFCAAAGAAGWALARPGAVRVAAAGVASGLLLLCKATSLLIAPMLALLAAWRAACDASGGAARRLAPFASAAGRLAVALLVVWLAYGVSTSSEPARGALDWTDVEAASGAFPSLLRVAREGHLLPEAWLHGVGYAFVTTRERVSFAAGVVGSQGRWWYFPYCVLVKTPLGTLALLALAAAAGARSIRQRRAAAGGRAFPGTAPLWILLGVYGAASVASNVNIGIRHLLPMFGPALILAGAAVRWCDTRWGRVAVPLLVVASALESASVHPHYLSFFNLAAGGPEAGYRHLVDSNLDWGQDLPALGDWLAEQRARGDAAPCFLSYFGSALPRRHGVDCARLPGFFDAPPEDRAAALGPGLYAISATMLQGVYLEPPLRGAWGAAQQARLAALDALLADPGRLPPARIGDLERVRERMRFAKLLSALRERSPDARVAYSILVYRVSSEELSAALAAAPRGA